MVRIFDAGDTAADNVRGLGMLVAPDRVLTCAHVLPPDPVAEFVEPPGAPRVAATVVPGAIFEANDHSQRGDIALLALAEPQLGRVTAALRRFPVGRVRRFRAYAFPLHREIGSWAMATLVGQAGPGGEWIQLQNESGLRVVPGFSGAGVLAEPYGHLVGMVVAAHPGDRQAFMIPAETIARYLPGVPWIIGEQAIADDFAQRRPRATPDATMLREVSEFVGDPAGVNVRVVISGPDDSDRSAAVHEVVMSAGAGGSGGEGGSGGVDLVVDCAGRTVEEITRRIAERAGVDPPQIAGPHAPPMTIVFSRVDRATDPADMLRSVVHPLSERNDNRILLTFDEENSASLPLAQAIERERSSRRSDSAGMHDAVAAAVLAERTARKLHRRATALIRGVPPLPAPSAPDSRETAADARQTARAAARKLEGLLRQHADLRGLLSSFQQLSAQYGRAEDPALTMLYGRAYALLHDGPADLAEAEAAVDEYAEAVRKWRP
jgi:hypothetical protein